MKNITILVSAHKPSDCIQNEILKTIEVGSDCHKTGFLATYHDNTGDNISSLNSQYCELTAQYWAWKNLDADYYGFFHYRRYFSFRHIDAPYDSWGNLNETFFDSNTVEKYALDTQSISTLVEKYDFILPEEKNILQMPNMGKNMHQQYIASGYLHEKDLLLMMEVLEELSPEMMPYAQEYDNGHMTYFNNMFIAKKEIFVDYSQWLFKIVDECYRRMDMSYYSVEALRTPGHLAERLLNIYFRYLKAQKKYTYTELQTVAFMNTDPQPEVLPAFAVNNVAIALSANDFYVPYLSAVLLSIKAHMTKQNNYDILVMTQDISKINQTKLKNTFSEDSNASLRFINVSCFGSQFKNLFLRGHFALETYFRLLMPELMLGYQKILYIDSDLIVNEDLAVLYQTDVTGYLLAACHDADTAGLYNGFEPNKKYYMDSILKIEKPFEYFQAGVILFNLEEFRKSYSSEEMLRFAASNQWELLDQDVLNYLAQGRYLAVDMAWNVMTDWRGIRIEQIISKAPKALRDEYMVAHAAPKIIHYAGPDKPWHQPYADYAEYFWKYARVSPFYEVLIQRLSSQEAKANQPVPMYEKIKGKLRDKMSRIADRFFPKYTRRREILKKLVRR